MSLNYAPQTVSAEEYQRIFELERSHEYPMIDAFEERMGFSVDRQRLEDAARVLSCPFKAAAPNWQHGRVLYAASRAYLHGKPSGCWTFLDIGTAKGFSAMCLQWALNDHAGGSMVGGAVTSVDVLPQNERVRRNTVAEIDGLKTLAEILAPWPEAQWIGFVESTGIDWLKTHPEHIHIAFVDGKHSGPVVRKEGVLLSARQQSGDLVIFDDVHIPEVSVAVTSLHPDYVIEYIQVLPKRAYAVAVRQ